jgi:hypothetical protein
MSDETNVLDPEADSSDPPSGWYVERARALIAGHAELFGSPGTRQAERSLAVVRPPAPRRRSPQLRLPLRPTMRR